MISASIKLGNLHYLQALEELAIVNLPGLHIKPKLLQLPFYNFVCSFIEILSFYSKSHNRTELSCEVIYNFNSFLVDYYFKKHQGNSFEIYRQLFSFLRSWKKFTDNHEEAKLFLSLLTPQRNTIECAKTFIRFRKCILKSLNQKILQELSLTHQDALTIAHTLFSENATAKSYVTKKINELFISLKRKLINNAKVNGAVMCEFFMACAEKFAQLNHAPLFQLKPDKKMIFRQIVPNNNKAEKPSPKHNRPTNYLLHHNCTAKPNQMNYNLSFSEQFASYYSPQTQQFPEIIDPKVPENKFLRNFQELENQWQITVFDHQTPINLVKNSLTFFKKKDNEIDEKLAHCKTFHLNQQNLVDLKKINHSPEVINYPEGWQKFLKTNAKTKRKLMSNRKLNAFQQIC